MSKNESYFSGEKYNLKAKKLGYRSRAAFKLIDINKKENILRKNLNIIDLGSAPGGWSQVVSKELNGTGSIIAIDILDMPKIKDVKFIKSDLREFDQNKLNQPIDVVISDEFLSKEINKRFKIMKRLKPDSSRKISKEIYFLGLNKN